MTHEKNILLFQLALKAKLCTFCLTYPLRHPVLFHISDAVYFSEAADVLFFFLSQTYESLGIFL